MMITLTIDKYATEFLERVCELLIAVEQADEVLVTDEILQSAAELRRFFDDHGKKFFA